VRRVVPWIAGLLLVVIGAVGGLAAWLIYGDRALPAQKVTVLVERGSSVSQIGAQLRAQGVVRSARLLSEYLRLRGLAPHINAAEYDFPPHQTLDEIATVLQAGGRPPAVWITVPEGFTALQIAQRLAAARLDAADDFMDVVRTRSLRLGDARSDGLEGYLFPETYQILRDASAEDVATLMTDQFFRELPPDHSAAAKKLGFKMPQIITLASIIEREAKVDSERAVMAGVYYNRLRLGMPLEVDATIEYALPKHKPELSLRDLAVDSPYNTYTHVGLPPTPISNPGKRSISAALHPQHVGYLYYVYCGHGRHQFSNTLDEQVAAEQHCLH
jgi:UPF0755 protein